MLVPCHLGTVVEPWVCRQRVRLDALCRVHSDATSGQGGAGAEIDDSGVRKSWPWWRDAAAPSGSRRGAAAGLASGYAGGGAGEIRPEIARRAEAAQGIPRSTGAFGPG